MIWDDHLTKSTDTERREERMLFTRDDLVPEQLTDDQCQRGATVGEGDVEALDVTELAEHGFAIAWDRFRADAVRRRTQGRRASEGV